MRLLAQRSWLAMTWETWLPLSSGCFLFESSLALQRAGVSSSIMEGDHNRVPGHGSSDSVEGDWMWARMVQGPPKGPTWTGSPRRKLTNSQVYFSNVLELLESLLEDSRRQWENLSVMVRSLSRRVLADWVAKEIRVKSKFDHDLEIFPVVEDHLIGERPCMCL